MTDLSNSKRPKIEENDTTVTYVVYTGYIFVYADLTLFWKQKDRTVC